MIAALQADQGLARSIWMSVGDIMWLARSFPNTSSHTFTLSWGMLNTWPVGGGKRTQRAEKCVLGSSKWIRGAAGEAREPVWRVFRLVISTCQ